MWIALTLVVGLLAASAKGGGTSDVRAVASASTTTTVATRAGDAGRGRDALATGTTPTTVAATTSAPPATAAPSTAAAAPASSVITSTAPPPPDPTVPAPTPSPVARPAGWGLAPYSGLGTWIDVYDWTAQYGGAQISIADIDQMAADGVQTLYVQPVRWDSDTDLMETDRLLPLLERARADGLRVVAWYLPDLRDIDKDTRHLYAIANQLPIDGLAIDIESRSVDDVDLRNAQLMALSDRLRATYPGQVLGAIVLPPVVLDTINPNYWPGYPWSSLARDYDIWLPMAYFTNRVGYWRDAYRYTATNVSSVRSHIGNQGALVATIGGIGDGTTPDDVSGMVTACQEQACFGASLYDYRTTQDADVRAAMRGFRQ
jgi:hypothetical protein